MDLRQLSYLVAVSESGGIRAAARSLYVAQPTISNALRLLELELGAVLVLRTPQGTELTPAGEELVRHARDLLVGFTAAREAVRRVVEQTSEILRVGMVSGMVSAGELVSPIIAGFARGHPNVELELSDISFGDQVTPLLAEVVDVLLVRGPLERGPLAHSELTVVPLAEEPRALLVASDHELAAESAVSAGDVLDLPTLPLAAPDGWSGFWQLDDLRGGAATDERVAPVSSHAEVEMAVASRGVVISTPAAAMRFHPNPLVRAVPLTDAPLAVIGVAYRRRDSRPHVRQFVQAAVAAAELHLHLMPGAVAAERHEASP